MVLGHHSPAFTLATYVHLIPDDLPEPRFLHDQPGAHASEPRGRSRGCWHPGAGRAMRWRTLMP